MFSEDTIEVYRLDNQMVNDAIDHVVVEVYKKRREAGHKIYLMTGSSVGCGTTTNAINLAVALAGSGWKTILVDCDIRKGMHYKHLNEEVVYGLSDHLHDDQIACIYHTNYPCMDYMPCGSFQESPVRLLCSHEMEALLMQLREYYEFIILDFPSINVVPDAEILYPFVDDVILVASLNETTRKQLDVARQKVAADKYMGIIANKVDHAHYKRFLKDYDYFAKRKIEERFRLQHRGQQDRKQYNQKKKAE